MQASTQSDGSNNLGVGAAGIAAATELRVIRGTAPSLIRAAGSGVYARPYESWSAAFACVGLNSGPLTVGPAGDGHVLFGGDLERLRYRAERPSP